MFAGKARGLPEDSSLQDSTPREGSLVLSRNIRLGWKWLTVTNTLAYYGVKITTAVRVFVVFASEFAEVKIKAVFNKTFLA